VIKWDRNVYIRRKQESMFKFIKTLMKRLENMDMSNLDKAMFEFLYKIELGSENNSTKMDVL
jgi:hypothetical protein